MFNSWWVTLALCLEFHYTLVIRTGETSEIGGRHAADNGQLTCLLSL